MLLVKEITSKDVDLCFEFDLITISLWTKKQWQSELRKDGIKVFGLFLSDFVIGICSIQIILDEVQINFFAINNNFRRNGFGTLMMRHLFFISKKLKIKKILLEVSKTNSVAENFYSHFNFCTVGIRKNFYKDGSDALLKEKKLIKK